MLQQLIIEPRQLKEPHQPINLQPSPLALPNEHIPNGLPERPPPDREPGNQPNESFELLFSGPFQQFLLLHQFRHLIVVERL